MKPSPEQQRVIETWGQGMSVMAGAGSGKTTTLVSKCVELLRLNPEARFAAVSFTEKSASDLRGKLSQLLRLDGQGHWVMTIHGLCSAILREYPREAGYDGEETMLSESEAQLLWERAIEQVWSDEAQPEIQAALERMLGRESRDSLWGLLRRIRDLHAGGILDSLGEKSDDDSKALACLATFVLERYDRLKRRRGALDFNDLERGADLALEKPAVREAFQKRFALVLIDEFQDTNPVQARIILRFVKPDLTNLCVVGDPKQSIYRFRDADVSVFEEFCAKLPVNISLTWNFRSRPGILDFTNRVCEQAFDATPAHLMARYEALVPKRESRPSPEGIEPVLKLDIQSPQDLATWILSETARGVPLQDMALLLRKIRGNEYWLKALTAAGIPIALGSGGLFWEDPRTREMVSFLKWWENPANTLSGAVFLRAPWVGIPDSDLDRWREEDPTWVKPFFASAHPLARELGKFRNQITSPIVKPGDLLMALLAPSETGERIEAELGATLLGLWHRVEDLSSRGLDFHAVVAELALATEEKRREKEVPPPRNEGQLSVLTLHGSKGLEFPHVILVDLGKKNRASNSPSLFWDRARGVYLVQKDSLGERIEDPTFEEWKRDERAKELAESKRIFYVALTRAQERLVLVCPELPPAKENPGKSSPEKNPKEVYEQDFWRGWIESSGALTDVPSIQLTGDRTGRKAESLRPGARPWTLNETASTGLESISKNTRPFVFPATRPRHSVTEWNLLSRCARAYEWTHVRPRKIEFPREFDWLSRLGRNEDENGLSQRELGTEVHACLEKGDYERLEELEKRVGRGRFQADSMRQWAENSPYMNTQAGLLKRAWSELAFEIPVAGEVLVGSVDRAVESDSGLSVIDFKVTRHEKTPEALVAAYRTQMDLYRFALAALSGFSRIEAVLVGFSDSGVQEVKLPPSQLDVESLARQAARIIRGEEGAPTPGSLCEVCHFRSDCPASSVAGI